MIIRIKVIEQEHQYNLKNREIFLYSGNAGNARNAELELGAPELALTGLRSWVGAKRGDYPEFPVEMLY